MIGFAGVAGGTHHIGPTETGPTDEVTDPCAIHMTFTCCRKQQDSTCIRCIHTEHYVHECCNVTMPDASDMYVGWMLC